MTTSEEADTVQIEQVIGENVATARKAKEWTQTELADAMTGRIGKTWTRQAVWAAEQGKRAFPAAELLSLAYVLDSTVESLMRPPPGLELVGVGRTGLDVIALLESRVPESSARDSLRELQENVALLAESLRDVDERARDVREVARRLSMWVPGDDV